MNLLNSCLEVIAEEGWERFTFEAAAQKSGVSLDEYRRQFDSPADVMRQLFQHIDELMLKELSGDSFDDCETKEALFEIIMARLDVSGPYKAVLKGFWFARDIPAALCLAPQGMESAIWILNRAGVPTNGMRGALRVQGFATLYLMVLQKWFSDESADHAQTMAFLDQALGRMDRLARALSLDH